MARRAYLGRMVGLWLCLMPSFAYCFMPSNPLGLKAAVVRGRALSMAQGPRGATPGTDPQEQLLRAAEILTGQAEEHHSGAFHKQEAPKPQGKRPKRACQEDLKKMLPFGTDRWHPICDAKEVFRGKPHKVHVNGVDLCVYRLQGQGAEPRFAAVWDVCLHRGASLSMGRVVGDNVQCPYHGIQANSLGNIDYIPGKGKCNLCKTRFSLEVAVANGWIYIRALDPANPDYQPFSLPEALRVQRQHSVIRQRGTLEHEPFPEMGELRGWSDMPTNADILFENTMDTLHVSYVHEGSFGNAENLPKDMRAFLVPDHKPQEQKGKMVFHYDTGPKSFNNKLFGNSKIEIEVEFHDPYVSLIRQWVGPTTLLTTVTAIVPTGPKTCRSYWVMYRNFAVNPVADLFCKAVVMKVYEEDHHVLRGVNTEHGEGLLHIVPFDDLQILWRKVSARWAKQGQAQTLSDKAIELELIAKQATLTLDENDIILQVDESTHEMFGYSASDLVGRPFSVLAPPQYPESQSALKHKAESIAHEQHSRTSHPNEATAELEDYDDENDDSWSVSDISDFDEETERWENVVNDAGSTMSLVRNMLLGKPTTQASRMHSMDVEYKTSGTSSDGASIPLIVRKQKRIQTDGSVAFVCTLRNLAAESRSEEVNFDLSRTDEAGAESKNTLHSASETVTPTHSGGEDVLKLGKMEKAQMDSTLLPAALKRLSEDVNSVIIHGTIAFQKGVECNPAARIGAGMSLRPPGESMQPQETDQNAYATVATQKRFFGRFLH